MARSRGRDICARNDKGGQTGRLLFLPLKGNYDASSPAFTRSFSRIS